MKKNILVLMVVVVVLDMDLVRVVVVVGVVVVANHEISYCQKNLNLIFLMKVEESLQRKQQSLKTSIGRQVKLFFSGRPFLSWRAFQIRAHSKCWQSHQCQILRESVHQKRATFLLLDIARYHHFKCAACCLKCSPSLSS